MKLTLAELTDLTQGTLIQEGLRSEFSGIAALDDASESDISFLGNEKYREEFLETKAGVVIVPLQLKERPSGVALIEVENPSFSFGEIIKQFSKRSRGEAIGVHPSACVAEDVVFDPTKVSVRAGAIVESGCVIGDGSVIGAGAVLTEHVKVGEDCYIQANATIREYCELGDRVILQPGCVIGSDGYGYEFVDGEHKKVDQVGIVVLEDDVEIGANTTIDRARFGKTLIGKGTKIDNLVQIAHNVTTGEHCLVVSQTGIAGSTHLGNHVTVAAQVGMTGHLKIGDKATLLARTGVTKNLNGDQVYMGNPARPAQEEQKKRASIARLPKMMKEFRSLKKVIEEIQCSGEK